MKWKVESWRSEKQDKIVKPEVLSKKIDCRRNKAGAGSVKPKVKSSVKINVGEVQEEIQSQNIACVWYQKREQTVGIWSDKTFLKLYLNVIVLVCLLIVAYTQKHCLSCVPLLCDTHNNNNNNSNKTIKMKIERYWRQRNCISRRVSGYDVLSMKSFTSRSMHSMA